VLSFAILSVISAQEIIELQCRFTYSFLGLYTCQMPVANVSNPNAIYRFVGEHQANYTNDDVVNFETRYTNFEFIPQQLFTTFPNLIEMEIRASNLKSINISGTDKFQQLYFSSNNISRIENGTFARQSNLTLLVLNLNQIIQLDEDAFIGLNSCNRLTLLGNNITELPGRIFNNVPTLRVIDLEENQLKRIENGTFSELELTGLYLEYNEINEISPDFAKSVIRDRALINLRGNRCTNHWAFFIDDLDIVHFNMNLGRCYENYNQRSENDERRLTMEFNGRLNIYDRFNNLISIINNNSEQ
jgi:Leucine-rich repeat (LRR) protein